MVAADCETVLAPSVTVHGNDVFSDPELVWGTSCGMPFPIPISVLENQRDQIWFSSFALNAFCLSAHLPTVLEWDSGVIGFDPLNYVLFVSPSSKENGQGGDTPHLCSQNHGTSGAPTAGSYATDHFWNEARYRPAGKGKGGGKASGKGWGGEVPHAKGKSGRGGEVPRAPKSRYVVARRLDLDYENVDEEEGEAPLPARYVRMLRGAGPGDSGALVTIDAEMGTESDPTGTPHPMNPLRIQILFLDPRKKTWQMQFRLPWKPEMLLGPQCPL
jgi:hypothetical protein